MATVAHSAPVPVAFQLDAATKQESGVMEMQAAAIHNASVLARRYGDQQDSA